MTILVGRRALLHCALALSLGSVFCFPGCGTLMDIGEIRLHDPDRQNTGLRVFGGVRRDLYDAGQFVLAGELGLGWLAAFPILDIPCSLILDTVLLPLTIPIWLSRDPESTTDLEEYPESGVTRR